MKAIIIGGLGRSGTSLIYKWFAANPNAVSIGNSESKLFSEPYGLTDLYRALVSDYTFARGKLAIEEFRILTTKQLVDSNFTGQDSIIASLSEEMKAKYFDLITDFVDELSPNAVPTCLTHFEFCDVVRRFVVALISLFGTQNAGSFSFVEKTPHNALCPWIYDLLFDDVRYVWIIRNPRAVVYSTLKQDWGPNNLDGAIEYVRQVIRRYVDVRDLNRQMEIRLEDIVYDGAATIEKVQKYCEFGMFPGVEPASEGVIEDWRNYLFGDELEKVERLLLSEISLLGY